MSDEKFFKAALAVILIFAGGLILKLARPVLIPFILAVFISYIIDPTIRPNL